jgi:hypothetical protein
MARALVRKLPPAQMTRQRIKTKFVVALKIKILNPAPEGV